MRNNNPNRTWANSLGDYLNGDVGINKMRPDSQLFDDLGMQNILNNTKQYHLVITQDEAKEIIDDLTKRTSTGITTPESFARGLGEQITAITRGEELSRGIGNGGLLAPVYGAIDYTGSKLSVYNGNLHDVKGLYDTLMEFKSFGIKAKIITGDKGVKFIHLTGYAGIRKTLKGTRYLATNPRIIEMGIGVRGVTTAALSGAKFCIIFSVGYRIAEFIFRDDYTFADFVGNISVDMAKIALSALAGWAIGVVLTAIGFAAGSIIAVAAIVIVAGFIISYYLNKYDEEHGISKTVIALIKKAMEPKSRAPEANLQYIFNGLGRY